MSTDNRGRSGLDPLKALPLFRGCTDKELRRIDRLVCTVGVGAGVTLCHEGRVGRESFFIVSGQAEVSINGVPIATLGRGDFFGEMSVLDGDRRVATVTAITPMTLLVCSANELGMLLDDVPRVARRMLAIVGSRLRLADGALPLA